MNIAQWSDDNLHWFGDYEAITDGTERWTNKRVHDESVRIAGALRARDVRPGARVALLFQNGGELVSAFTGVLRAGGCWADE